MQLARVAPAQGSLPSMATRPDITCGKTAGDLQSLNFNFWEFPHYMTVPVLTERDHLSCHAVKLQSLWSSTAPWLFHLKTGAMDYTVPSKTTVFLLTVLEYPNSARLAQPCCDPFSHSGQARSSAFSHFIHSQTPLRSIYCIQQNGWDFFKPLPG